MTQQQLSLMKTLEPLHEGIDDKSIIILLDLNYTLVSNSPLKVKMRGSYASKIDAELYRDWLVELVRGHTVCLCTVRYVGYEAQTLKRIEALTGWKPEYSYFNPLSDVWQGYKVKEPYLMDSIVPMFGTPKERRYLALESSRGTRGMYKRHGIHAVSVPNEARWERLPFPREWGI